MRKTYTEEDYTYLRKNYGKIPTSEIAEHFGTTVDAVNQTCFRKNISSGRFFSDEEERFILEKFGVMSSPDIAKALHRSPQAVKNKISKMGLGRMIDHTDAISITELARMTGRTRGSISRTWVKRGLVIKKRGRYSVISQQSIAKVMRENPDLWDATECEADYFEYYDWFHPKLLEDRQKASEKRWGA